MTAAQAQTATSAAIGQGYTVDAAVDSNTGEWSVIVSPGRTALDLQVIAAFAAANGLAGTLQRVSLK